MAAVLVSVVSDLFSLCAMLTHCTQKLCVHDMGMYAELR